MSRIFFIIACCLTVLNVGGCVVYEPVPVAVQQPGPSNFDRAWQAALGGAQDAGVKITSADQSTGLIRGTRDGSDLSIVVARQGDGSVRVQFNAKGTDRGLADRVSQAYDRRMAGG